MERGQILQLWQVHVEILDVEARLRLHVDLIENEVLLDQAGALVFYRVGHDKRWLDCPGFK